MMATNVLADQLNYHHYSRQEYDEDIVRSIPGHAKLHDCIQEVIRQDYLVADARVLELGVGTGLTSEVILQNMQPKSYMAIDFSEPMLASAKERLSRYDVNFVCADYSQVSFPQHIDLVVSVIGIHHQETDADKQSLFKKIYACLASCGSFLFGDLVTYKDPSEAALQEAKHFHFLVEHAKDENSLREWAHHHRYLNNLAPLEDQVDWLFESGFRDADVLFQECNTALVYARK